MPTMRVMLSQHDLTVLLRGGYVAVPGETSPRLEVGLEGSANLGEIQEHISSLIFKRMREQSSLTFKKKSEKMAAAEY